MSRVLVSALVAAAVLLAPTAAGASDQNVAVATNVTDGTAVVDASVDFRVAANGVVDQENVAYAAASCVECQSVAAAFQIVLVKRDFDTFVPYNEAFGANVDCDRCLSWSAAKQIIVVSSGPATLTGAGHQRLKALEGSIEAMQADLPGMSLTDVQAALNAAFDELLDIAQTEIRGIDGGPDDAEVAATLAS